MSDARDPVDLAIIGGGLAGLMAAARAEALGFRPTLLNVAVPNTPRQLGGFAPFSGAKFSLFPAGTGLAPLFGGEDALIGRYADSCREFAALGFPEFDLTAEQVAGEESETRPGLAYRNYHSVLLTPVRMGELLTALSSRLSTTQVVRAAVTRLDLRSGPPFAVHVGGEDVLHARRLIMAAGRLGALLLKSAGVTETGGKGIDLGVRLEFPSQEPLRGLRQLGPDAKFLADGVRTFCLNSPGRIFHYPGAGFSLPGGIVAEADRSESNVGVLVRLSGRHQILSRLAAAAEQGEPVPLSFEGGATGLSWPTRARVVLSDHVCDRIDAFLGKLTTAGLLDLPSRFIVHYPLLDWHWPVFSLPSRLATTVPGVLAAGDASGHARGLLQAAVTGAASVEEALT